MKFFEKGSFRHSKLKKELLEIQINCRNEEIFQRVVKNTKRWKIQSENNKIRGPGGPTLIFNRSSRNILEKRDMKSSIQWFKNILRTEGHEWPKCDGHWDSYQSSTCEMSTARNHQEILQVSREETQITQRVSIHGFRFLRKGTRDFSGGAVVKNLPANAGDMGSSPGPGRSHMPRSN